jgi:hypothetical protein
MTKIGTRSFLKTCRGFRLVSPAIDLPMARWIRYVNIVVYLFYQMILFKFPLEL